MGAFSLIVVINLLNSLMSGDDVFCVGLWVSAAKLEKLRFDKLRDYMKPHNIELLVLNDSKNKLRESLDMSRMDLILFKLTDSTLTEEQKNLRFADRLESVEKLLDRLQTSHITQTVCASMATLQNVKCEKLVRCKLPEEPIELFLSSNNLRFPLICKPKATGYRCLHSMVLLFDDKQLDEFCSSHKPHVHSSEFVVANFVNHGSCLLKVSVIGAHVFVFQRPSVRNFYPHTYPQSCIYFDTADVSKLSSKSDLIGPREHVQLEDDLLKHLVFNYSITGLCLFGVDIIKSQETGELYVIDVNHFPGFEDVFKAYPLNFVFNLFLLLFNRYRNKDYTLNLSDLQVHR